MEQGDFDLLKDIPGFKAILRAILKSQMKHLIEQLSKHGGEEAMVLTTSIVDGSFYQLGSAGAEGFLENRDEIKSQFLGYCLKNVHQQQTEQSHDVEKTVDRTKDKTGLNISPRSSKSKKSVSAARKQSESTVLPVSLTRVEERTLSETDTYQTGPNAGSSDLNKRKGRGRRKRPSETITSEKQAKRAAVAKTVTFPPHAVQASVESSQGITVVTGDNVKIKDEIDAEGAKAMHPKDAFNILPLHAEAEGAKAMHPKDAFNILPRHTESETSDNKDDTDTRESNGSEEPDQSMDNIENEGVLTGIKVEPADQEEIADAEDSTSLLQLDYSATTAEGEDGANDSVTQQSGNFNICQLNGQSKNEVTEAPQSTNTKRKTEFDMHLLKNYLEEMGETRDIEFIPIQELDAHFGNFLLNVRKIKDGSQYGAASFVGFVSSFNRYLRGKGIPYQVNRCLEFQYSATVLKAKTAQLRAVKVSKESKELSKPDIEKLFHIGELGLHRPDALINFLCVNIMYVLGVKNYNRLRNLKWGDIEIHLTKDGIQYLTHARDHDSSPRSEDLTIAGSGPENLKPKIYSHENKAQCPVEAYKLYASKRPYSMAYPHNPFFLAVCARNPKDGQAWFKAQPMGVNTLRFFMKNLHRKSKLVL